MKTTTEKLNKTLNSINNHIMRGNYKINSQRAYDLVDRYNELKNEAIENGTWENYCVSKGFVVNHNAADLWA